MNISPRFQTFFKARAFSLHTVTDCSGGGHPPHSYLFSAPSHFSVFLAHCHHMRSQVAVHTRHRGLLLSLGCTPLIQIVKF